MYIKPNDTSKSEKKQIKRRKICERSHMILGVTTRVPRVFGDDQYKRLDRVTVDVAR